LTSTDNSQIYCQKWIPESGAVKAVVQIAHGMAEHIERYTEFAEELTKAGLAVYGNDHRGHGKTAGTLDRVGFLSDDNGFNLVVEDMKTLTETINREYPEHSIVLLGHSMGSLLARHYIYRYENRIKCAIFSGLVSDPGILGGVGLFIANLVCAIKGKRSKSPLLDTLSFGQFNASFKPNRTKFDWLSRDPERVDLYINDPFCGTIFSAGFFKDLLTGLKEIKQIENSGRLPLDIPIYMFSGDKDPVGDNTTGVQKIHDLYKKAGVKDLTLKFYPDGRHEMLNEINRDEVYRDIIQWIESKL
jgi:alpha-beta hydrolase superfamily lysophospholipase